MGVLKSLLCSWQEVGAMVHPTCTLPEFVPVFLPWSLSTPQAWWESVPCNRITDPVQNRQMPMQPHALGLRFPHYHAQTLKEGPVHF